MDDLDEQDAPLSSLLDGEYCSETTEDFDEEDIPYSLRLLMEQMKRELTLKNRKKNEQIERN